MNKEINLCIPTLRRLDLLIECIKSAAAGKLKPTKVYICDNGDICDGVPPFDIPVEIYNPGGNYGVGRSWNHFLHTQKDYIIICNDDVTFYPDTIEKLVTAAEKFPKQLFFTCEGPKDWNWALFLQRKRSLLEIGEYDGMFYPAYYEDSDYRRRMELKGHKPAIVDGCHYGHYGGATAKFLQKTGEHVDNEETLEKYYHMKWGGPRYQETYTSPFNFGQNKGSLIEISTKYQIRVDDEDIRLVNLFKWYYSESECKVTVDDEYHHFYLPNMILKFPDYGIEHINGNPFDCRKCNLRPKR